VPELDRVQNRRLTVAAIDTRAFDDRFCLIELCVDAERRHVALGGGRAHADHPPLKHAADNTHSVRVVNSAEGPRDTLSVEILSTAAQLYENIFEKACSR